MGNYGEIMNLGCHFLCCRSLFFVVVWPLASTDMSDFHPHNNVLYVRLSCLNKVVNSNPARIKSKPSRTNSNPSRINTKP